MRGRRTSSRAPSNNVRINFAPSAAALANPAANGVNTCVTGELCQPNQFTVTNDPTLKKARMRAQVGIFVQDKWTYKRLTLSGGVRFDYLHRDAPDQTLTPSPLAPTRNTHFPQEDATNYKDLSPRFGMAYDVFGNGKTAFKLSINRYLNDLSLFNNVGGTKIQGYQTSASRTWTDDNHNFYPDCDFLTPTAQDLRTTGGDRCGAFTGTSANFGTVDRRHRSTITTLTTALAIGRTTGSSPPTYSRSSFRGGCRLSSTSSGGLYGNFSVSDNPLTTAANYDTFSVRVPTDPELPLSGQTLDFVDPNPSVSSLVTTNEVFLADHFGKQTEIWTGYDVSLVYRVGRRHGPGRGGRHQRDSRRLRSGGESA